ncbi:MAG: adenylate/guanylate cyclase domain-containing protein [Pseudomonadota bacterium]
MKRRLAAILVADVVGYTARMERDEAATLEDLQEIRNSFVAPTLERFEGRVVKWMGDGLLAEFASVVNAALAAVEMQRAAADRNTEAPPERRLEFRVGVNLGDVMVEEDDVYGDGVNVAARLQELCRPGGVCISRPVRDQVRDKLGVDLADMGRIELKNVSRPMRVYELRPSGAGGDEGDGRGARPVGIASTTPPAERSVIADAVYGGYPRRLVSYYEGRYICARAAFTRPDAYVFYPMTMAWSEAQGALTFEDGNPGFEQRGVVAMPTGAGFVHLLTLDAGSARLMTVEHMPERRSRMFGMVMTLANPAGRDLYPAAAPILIERTDRTPLAYADCVGAVPRDDPRLTAFPHALFDAAPGSCVQGLAPG